MATARPGWSRRAQYGLFFSFLAVIGGIIGSVVIRGGMGGVDHCDPRTDGRRGGGYPSIPTSRMPVINGGGRVFGGHRH